MNEEERFDPSRHTLADAAKRLKEISARDYTVRIAHALGEHDEENTDETSTGGVIEDHPVLFGNDSPEVVHMPQQPTYTFTVNGQPYNPTLGATNIMGGTTNLLAGWNGGAQMPLSYPVSIPPAQVSGTLDLTPYGEESLREIVAETIQRVLYPEQDGVVTHQHRRVRQWDENGDEWRGVLYKVEKESEL